MLKIYICLLINTANNVLQIVQYAKANMYAYNVKIVTISYMKQENVMKIVKNFSKLLCYIYII